MSVKLVAVGDVMLGDDHLSVGIGVGSQIRKKGVDYLFSNVQPSLRNGDIVFCNLEAVISDSNIDKRTLNSVAMRAQPDSSEGLARAGFNIVSLANNHVMDHGTKALTDTITLLSNAGISRVGPSGCEAKDHSRPFFLLHREMRVAFLAFCFVSESGNRSSTVHQEEVCSRVRQAREEADVLIVSLHWGDEYMESPSPAQIELGHRIIDSGASLILGHHPHVVQGVEEYHDGLIAYSLGNFVFGIDYLEQTKTGIILKCELTTKGVAGYEIVPTGTDIEHRPILLERDEKAATLEKLRRMSRELEDMHHLNSQNRLSEYESQVEVVKKAVRRKMIVFFAKNIHRYPPQYALQIVLDFFRRRIAKVST